MYFPCSPTSQPVVSTGRKIHKMCFPPAETTGWLVSLMINALILYIFIVGLMSSLWRDNKSVRTWKITRPCSVFRQKYDHIQDHLQWISCMDDLLSGKNT